MTALSRSRVGIGPPVMRAFRSSVLLGALALLSVLGMSLAAGWHSAAFHDDDAAHVAALDRHDRTGHDDPDSDVHLVAHAIGHWFVTAPLAVTPRLWTSGLPLRLLRETPLLNGIPGATPLRPPSL